MNNRQVSIEINQDQLRLSIPSLNFYETYGTWVGIGEKKGQRQIFCVGSPIDKSLEPQISTYYEKHSYVEPFPINNDTIYCLNALAHYYFMSALLKIETAQGRYKTRFWGISGDLKISYLNTMSDSDQSQFIKDFYSSLWLINIRINDRRPHWARRLWYGAKLRGSDIRSFFVLFAIIMVINFLIKILRNS